MAINNDLNIYKLIIEHSNFSIDDYLHSKSYDEMAEIDLNLDELRLIYHVEGKYYNPQYDGSYSSLFDFCIDNMVHPDDVVTYRELMDPKTLKESFNNSRIPNFKSAEIRYKLQDGTYRWVEQIVLAGYENGLGDNVFRLYIFDINNRKSREKGTVSNDKHVITQNRDKTTRLLKEKDFFNECKEIYAKSKDKKWCFISLDIEHFRLFDEWYGRTAGIKLITDIGLIISRLEEEHGAIGGYFGQDDFAIMMEYDNALINKLYNDIRNLTISFGSTVGFMPAIGVCFIDKDNDILDTFNHASVACFFAKNDIKQRIYTYDAKMHSKSEQEYHILVDFIEALKNKELTFHLQPQYRISSKKIVGAESLARWNNKGVMISPAEFVPVLEKYGFVTDLDKYIWDEVCKLLRNWLDEGKEIVPISVNVSQVDIFTIDVPTYFNELIKKYNLTSNLIKIEITESAYASATDEVSKVVKTLRENGFTVLMDDFGSGYSSLNMLSSLNLDVIKLDARFLNISNGDNKGIQILESIISMTKVIGVPIIVEGVETKEQCDFLEGLGCRYVQGFYFHEPVDIQEFEKLIRDKEAIDDRGFVMKHNQQFSIREFLDKNIYSDSMLNNIIGAAAFYSWHGDDVDIIRFNQQFYETVNVPDFDSRLKGIQNYMPNDEKIKFYNMLQEAMNNTLNGSKGQLRVGRVDGTFSFCMMHFYYLGMQGDEKRFYGSLNEITGYALLREHMKLISKFSSDTIILLRVLGNSWQYKVIANGLEKELGITKDDFEKGLNDHSIFERVDPEAVPKFIDFAVASYKEKNSFYYDLKFRNKQNRYVDLRVRADSVDDEVSQVSYIVTVHLKEK